MRRHPALVPLSREHHQCLVLSQLLKRNAPNYDGLPSDDEGKKRYALEFLDHSLSLHIKAEEDILFPALLGKSEKLDQLVKELKAEHQEIIKAMNELEIAENLADAMDQLGHLLANHIRKEERTLFEEIQKRLPEEELALLHFPHTEDVE